jgi:hypothetical protein
MKSIVEQYIDLQTELDLNQQDYKERQNILLKKLEELQNQCHHYNTELQIGFSEPLTRCRDCKKILSK